jgi:cytoskeletal protein CcmA (bactofilin family)
LLPEFRRKIMASFGAESRQESREMPRPLPPTATQPFQAMPAAVPKVAVLGPTLRFKGELSAEEDFILQGSLEGSISNPQCVTVGTEGTVIGDIKARVITIDGKIEGDLYGDESVVVHESGRVTGNIYAPRVGIVEGAFFSGRIEMGGKPAASTAARPTVNTRANAPATVVPAVATPGVPLSPEATERVLGSR